MLGEHAGDFPWPKRGGGRWRRGSAYKTCRRRCAAGTTVGDVVRAASDEELSSFGNGTMTLFTRWNFIMPAGRSAGEMWASRCESCAG